jgi:hypothetical protein
LTKRSEIPNTILEAGAYRISDLNILCRREQHSQLREGPPFFHNWFWHRNPVLLGGGVADHTDT